MILDFFIIIGAAIAGYIAAKYAISALRTVLQSMFTK